MSQIDNGTAYPELTTPAGSDVLLGYRPAGADAMNHIVSEKLNVNNVNGQSLKTLATGLLKNTTTTGVPTIAVPNTDYLPVGSPAMTGTPTAPSVSLGTNTSQIAPTSNVVASVTSLTAAQSEVTIASAGTTDIGAAAANRVAISGTTTITSLGSTANTVRLVRFSGVLTLTHNATTLILMGASNITTASGDTAIFSSDGSANWRCLVYTRGSNSPLPSNFSASQLCRAWVNFNGTGAVAIRDQYNVSSITDNGAGDWTINFSSAMSNANYSVTSTARHVGTGGSIMSIHDTVAPTTSAVRLQLYNTVSGFLDSAFVCASIFSN